MIRKMKVSILALMVAGMSSGLFGGVIESIPPETNVIVKLDLAKLRSNNFYSTLKEKHIDKSNAFNSKMLQETGIDMDTVSTIWLAGVKKGEGALIVEGDFNAKKISEAVNAKLDNEEISRGDCIFAALCPNSDTPGGKVLAAVINPNLIAVGAPVFTDGFIRNVASKVQAQDFSSKGLLSGGKTLEAALIAIPEEMLMQKPFLADVTGGHFEVDLNGGVAMNMSLSMKDQEKAEGIQRIFEGMLLLSKGMNNGQQGQGPKKNQIGKDEFMENLKIEATGNTIKISTDISEEALNSIIAEQQIK